MADRDADDAQPRRGDAAGSARDDDRVLDEELPGEAEAGGRRDSRTGEGLDQGVAGPDARVAAARSPGDGRRRALVHGPDAQRAGPARSEDRPLQGISPQDASLGTAWAGRGQGWQHLV